MLRAVKAVERGQYYGACRYLLGYPTSTGKSKQMYLVSNSIARYVSSQSYGQEDKTAHLLATKVYPERTFSERPSAVAPPITRLRKLPVEAIPA